MKTQKRKSDKSADIQKKKGGPEKRKAFLGKAAGMAALILLGLAVCLFFLFLLLRAAGRRQMEKDTVGTAAGMTMTEGIRGERRGGSTEDLKTGTQAGAAALKKPEPEEAKERAGRVFYKGKAYDFNQDILTFLIMGIDQRTEKVTEYTEGFDAGSADAVFLLALDPHRKKIQVLAIDRNTMTDVDIYDYYGEYVETVNTQICVQHGFGDGTVKSAGYMEKAASGLLYGLPLNGYAAVNMSAIPRINDSIGGVELEALEDLTKADRSLVKGKTVHLMGKSAFWYVKYRDVNVFGSAEGRLERQKQYIAAFLKKAKRELKKDPSLAVRLFQDLSEYMTTDLTLGKAVYLADLAAGFEFGDADIRKIPGRTVMGEEYEEFYVDEKALYEIMLDVFYEEADS